MEKRIKQLPIYKKRLFILYLKYLLLIQNSEKYVTLFKRAFVTLVLTPAKPPLDEVITYNAHYIGRPAASIVYPERKKYAVKLLWYRIHLWLSVESSIDKSTPPLL